MRRRSITGAHPVPARRRAECVGAGSDNRRRIAGRWRGRLRCRASAAGLSDVGRFQTLPRPDERADAQPPRLRARSRDLDVPRTVRQRRLPRSAVPGCLRQVRQGEGRRSTGTRSRPGTAACRSRPSGRSCQACSAWTTPSARRCRTRPRPLPHSTSQLQAFDTRARRDIADARFTYSASENLDLRVNYMTQAPRRPSAVGRVVRVQQRQ